MKVVNEVEVGVVVKAVWRDGALDVSFTVSAPYADGRRSASAVHVFEMAEVEALKATMEQLLDRHLHEVARKAQHMAREAEVIAAQAGEI